MGRSHSFISVLTDGARRSGHRWVLDESFPRSICHSVHVNYEPELDEVLFMN